MLEVKNVSKQYRGEDKLLFDAVSDVSLSIPMDLSNDAKVLYALLLDRAGISKKKGYIETDGTIRLYFTVEDAKSKL